MTTSGDIWNLYLINTLSKVLYVFGKHIGGGESIRAKPDEGNQVSISGFLRDKICG